MSFSRSEIWNDIDLAAKSLAITRTIYYICVRYALILVCLFALTGCYSRSKPSSIGTPAPDFTITDSDRSVTLAKLRGKIVVLNFWATWCPPCVDEMPSLEHLQKKLQGTDITILAVSVDDDADDYHRFLKQHAIDLLTVRDSGRKTDTGVIAPVSSRYGTYKVPETYIIDRNGVIRRKFIGEVNWGQPEIMEYLSRL